MPSQLPLLVVLTVVLFGCSGEPSPRPADGSRADAAMPDASTPDGGTIPRPDGGTIDGAAADAATMDAAMGCDGACPSCPPGTYISAGGTGGMEPTCPPCEPGTFSADANAESCVPWGDCPTGIAEPGTSTRDRVCILADWIRQFGSSEADYGVAIRTDILGNVIVAGDTLGDLHGETAGWHDIFVRKFDASGNELWTRQFGSTDMDHLRGLAVDGSGNVLLAGTVKRPLPGQSSLGGYDAFVRKYDAAGNELWTRQFGSNSYDAASGIAVDASGDIIVVGSTDDALPGQPSVGELDPFVRKYAPTGEVIWTRQFGATSGNLRADADAVAVDVSGNIYIWGETDGALPGQSLASSFTDVYLRMYDAVGNERWTRQFGGGISTRASAVVVDPNGNVLVAGSTSGTLSGYASPLAENAFVRKYDSDGNELWTRQFGFGEGNAVAGASVDESGNVFVAGSTGPVGPSPAPPIDAFVRKYDPAGNDLWTLPFVSSSSGIDGVAVGGGANVFVIGTTDGTLPGQTSADYWDVFVMRLPL